MEAMINAIINASKSPIGEIFIRVACVLVVGAVGVRVLIKVLADIFELFATSKQKKIIEAIANLLGVIGCLLASLLTSILYSKGKTSFFIYGEGLLYGFGALGLYWLWITGKLKSFFSAVKNIRITRLKTK